MFGPDHVAAARAVYDASADRYIEFVGTEVGTRTEASVDRAFLAAFVDLLPVTTGTCVGDLGCGPGRVAGFLARHGLDVVGVDASSAMVARARIAHPDIRFEEAQLDELPFDDASLAGAVAWYSIIHTPPQLLGRAFAEFARVLDAHGHLLLGFQAGDGEPLHRANAHETGLTLTSFRHSVGDVTRRLENAGLDVHATALREPEFDHETTQQAFVIARARSSCDPVPGGAAEPFVRSAG